MLYPTLSAILLASALGVGATDVYNYGSANCGTNRMGGCRNLPQGQCCRFTNTYSTPEGRVITSATKSVRWINLQNCAVGSWFRPEARRSCGTVRVSATGPVPWTCLSSSGSGNMGDGAMWFKIIPTEGRDDDCPPSGIVEALPDPDFKVAMADAAQKINNIQNIRFPAGWGSMSKRSVAGRTVYETSADEPIEGRDAPKCEGVHYADTYIWGEGDSVWVVKGSKEAHDALNGYHAAPQPKQAYLDFVKSLGAKFYSDWRQSEELREDIEPQTEKHSAAEKRGSFPVIDAKPDGPGAGDKGVTVKATLN